MIDDLFMIFFDEIPFTEGDPQQNTRFDERLHLSKDNLQ